MVNRWGSLPRHSVDRLTKTARLDMTLIALTGRKTSKQTNKNTILHVP